MSVSFVEQAPPGPSESGTLVDLLVDPLGKAPIRAELFGQERLDAHARLLATACALEPPRKQSSPLLERFEENGRSLAKALGRIAAGAGRREGRSIDAEWLADNFHIVEEVLREVRQDFPQGYDRELPKLSGDPVRGYPRVLALALALVVHTDSELDEARITRYVEVFQWVTPLTIGELWALPTMLRLVLIENLRRLADEMIWGWDEWARAEDVAREILAGGTNRLEPGRALAPTPPSVPTDPFGVRLVQLLRDRGPVATAALQRLEERFHEQGAEVDDVLRREHGRQAANQLSIGNCVISLRLLSAMDWNAAFERINLVEVVLRDDPAGVYTLQDFATRDRYRRAVETIARRARADESEVAHRAVELARAGVEQGAARGHVGYYLVDRGLAELKRLFPPAKTRVRELLSTWTLGHPWSVYSGSILLLFAAIVGLLALPAAAGPWSLALVVLALLLPASELAVGIVNHVLTLVMPARVLPKLEFKEGIPADCPTFVVMPSMLIRPQSAEALLERLEIHYLANPDPRLRFALLTDFADAPQEHAPEDEGYIRDALARVRVLNQKYAPTGPDLFFLFHRRRIWNPIQGCWMGWERKRGKLSEFNRLIRGDRETSYQVLSVEDPADIPKVRFVITLDADTQMPRDSARRLVGTLAHPLNLPRFDPALGRVVEGHGVLQPRVSFHLTAATHSRFAAVLAASGGIDPYSSASSDTYMDLFGVGSFTGKGIYEVDAFEAATGHTFPENCILSHDLIEGNYARCGLVTDTELFDDFPARYHAYARREHRWVRGDWQLLPWLGRRVPAPEGTRANPLPPLERWKLFDNLRRSLVPPSLVLLLTLGWTALPGSPWLWTATALAVPALPLLQIIVATLVGCLRRGSFAGLLCWRDSIPATAAQVLLSITFLADQARIALDATFRTLTRLFVTKRGFLEWETAASTERRLGTGIASFFVSMWQAPASAIAIAALVAAARPSALVAAGPVLVSWFLSPLVAYWVSRPKAVAESTLSDDERRELRRIARRTWHFFETFVGDEDRWLPPDNFQEVPEPRVAHRTSPTNQGLLLLSTLTAHDLGYIGLRSLADRLEKTFDTFDQMEKHWGHFYNWHDTRTLEPLHPKYISTVDSGNLLGCLVALRQGLREKAEGPLIGPELAEGLADTLGLALTTLLGTKPPTIAHASSSLRLLEEEFRLVGRRLESTPDDLLGWEEWLKSLDWAAAGLIGRLRSFGAELGVPLGAPPAQGSRQREDGPPSAETPEAAHEHLDPFGSALERVEYWTRRFMTQVQERRAELEALAPWLAPLRDWRDSLTVGAHPVGPGESLFKRLLDPAGFAGQGDSTELEGWPSDDPARASVTNLVAGVRDSIETSLRSRLLTLADRADALAAGMEFRPLYKPDRHLYAIGCNLVQGKLDGACYDLIASESCLTSFLTIARGDAPRRHWFQLGRPFIRAARQIGLVSWGGTMFEYLMPRLMLKSLPGTLVDDACRTAVARQIEYGRELGTPWGVSESSYNAKTGDGDYHYQSFGVPGLGLKRELEKDAVIAPYATALAVMVAPDEALENFRRLTAEGAEGLYGYYEAVDYTATRVPKGKRAGIVRSYMAHHQGMSLVALANAVLDDPMPRRFHADPMVKAVDLLLQERIPRDASIIEPSETATGAAGATEAREGVPLLSRRLTSPNTPTPRAHLLSNGQYHVMVTNSGAGSSRCREIDVTRWREDVTRDDAGQFCYLRDVAGGPAWSAAYQPVGKAADEYEVTFSADKAAFRRVDGTLESVLEITVSPERLAEVRRVTLANLGNKAKVVEVTSYAEVVLGAREGDRAHPAFGKLFLETEWVPRSEALICRRRPRAAEQRPAWAVHVLAVDGPTEGEVQFETDRARFLGRGRTPADPAALDPSEPLSGTVGPVLDPVFSLRRRIRLEPGESASIAFTTAVVESREDALTLADQYHDASAVARAFELAWAHSQVEHLQRHWSPEDAQLFQRLASHILFAGQALRAAPGVLEANRKGTPDLWRHGISGDYPILLARFGDDSEFGLARELLAAHEFLKSKGLDFDLVFLDEQPATYHEALSRRLHELVRSSESRDDMDKPKGVFIRKSAQISEEDAILFQAAARVVLDASRGPLATQLDRIERVPALPAPFLRSREPATIQVDPEAIPELLFPNGFGGFSTDGREYLVDVQSPPKSEVRRNGKPHVEPVPYPTLPPAPWINVISNPGFGFLTSEAGLGYTWSGNSQANRLTPWSNDPVSDPPGEVLYLRDEETGEVWSPTPLPVPSHSPTLVRHGQGYTSYQRRGFGLEHELTVFVSPDDPVKYVLLKLRNLGDGPRSLSATYYLEWVLGTTRDRESAHVVTELDPETGAILARNAFRTDFPGRLSFVDVDLRPRTLTCDRGEFLGRNGSVAAPAALGRTELSGRVGAGLDPCAAVQAKFELAPGAVTEVLFVLGEADGLDRARELLRQHRAPAVARQALDATKARWESLLTTVQVRTPDPATDLLLNRWLLYQVLSCRLWGRSAFYQSGGAFGFRDQLQDVMALVLADPGETKAQILRASARQFTEGDVQHWWHPPVGRGVRTRISDDFLWLPFVVAHYIEATGDASILDERIPFLKGRPIPANQDDDYGLPDVADEDGTLYDHCARALARGERDGSHGLPLMGTGDWNDGMNRVGSGGKGESVWVAWFQIAVLTRFADLADSRGDSERAGHYRQRAESLRLAAESNAWDGAWYRRAYFDDGTPLGSAGNEECRIDSLAQTWAVISGAAGPERAGRAIDAVFEQLVRVEDGLILLLTPPFDTGRLQPGYIKGYVPGIRENGGQYTHAATWVVLAATRLGLGTRAFELFHLLNPITHGDSPEAVARYKVEPYVVAGDVYGRPPHTGRGGWTWYTGSAAWLYRVGLESILGVRKRGNSLSIDPCIPAAWPRFEVTYRHGRTSYRIVVENPEGLERGIALVEVDGRPSHDNAIPLVDDATTHEVRVVLGSPDAVAG